VVIVMLNLLIAIVSRVYERCEVNYEEEFLRAKAELICQLERGDVYGRCVTCSIQWHAPRLAKLYLFSIQWPIVIVHPLDMKLAHAALTYLY